MSPLIDICPSKRLAQLGLEQGKSLQSPITEFIHYCYEEESRDTIPTYENFCFVLAKLRSRVREEMEGAMTLLSRLLFFQTPSGNFPVYLHEFPKANNRNTAVHLLVPLFSIKKLFSHLFPAELKKCLVESISRLYSFCEKEAEKRPFPTSLLKIISAFNGTFIPDYQPETTIDWTNYLLAALVADKVEEVAQQAAAEFNQYFHTFTGAPENLFQRGDAFETTLYDLIMAQLTDSHPERLARPHIAHLHAAVVFPFKIKVLGHRETFLKQQIPSGPSSPHRKKGFHAFRMLFGPYSFVCQETTFQLEQDSVFVYPEEIPQEKERDELSFYVNRTDDLEILINGEKGTLFQLGDTLTLKSSDESLNLKWEIVEGEGTLLGHISLGNRPSQILKNAQTAYDWKITIRTIARSAHFKLKLSVVPLLEG